MSGIVEPRSEEVRGRIESTARLIVTRYGGNDFDFKRMIFSRVRIFEDGEFIFLKKSHRYHGYYQQKISEYLVHLPPEPEIPPHEDQKRREYLCRSRQKTVTVMDPPEGVTLKEVGLMELTAQFSARYGFFFASDLSKTERQDLSFINPEDRRFEFYMSLLEKHEKKTSRQAPYGESIMKGFLDEISKHENQREEGVIIDWKDFESKYLDKTEIKNPFVVLDPKLTGVNYQIPQRYQEQVLPFIKMMEDVFSYPLHDEPELTRQKLDELGLLPEDEFLAQHQGEFTITVSVPTPTGPDNIWKEMKFTVQSLSESVRGLKEKIADEIKIPTCLFKLISADGEAGFLKDTKSLAYYNVVPGTTQGIITVSH